jgi:cytochrome c biogenesis protein CcmG/thiol:disulfide interchange protein DsbE
MKKWFSKKSNLVLLVLITFLAIKQGPVILNNFKNEGIFIPVNQYQVIASNDKAVFPTDGNSIVIFWASWCGPCKIEMQRLKTSVEEGKIRKGPIYAINAFETSAEVEVFISQNNFPFIFLDAPLLNSILKIKATPTVVFLSKNKVISSSSGMSLTGIWKAESFLK